MSAHLWKLRKALSANSTASSFTSKLPATTAPSGSGVFWIRDPEYGFGHVMSCLPTFVELLPFGTDANNETFDMRLWGWKARSDSALFIPQLLLELNVTLGNIAEGTTNTFMADTIVVAAGDTDAAKLSLANDTPASIIVNMRGCEYLEFDFDLTGAAAANCYFCPYDY